MCHIYIYENICEYKNHVYKHRKTWKPCDDEDCDALWKSFNDEDYKFFKDMDADTEQYEINKHAKKQAIIVRHEGKTDICTNCKAMKSAEEQTMAARQAGADLKEKIRREDGGRYLPPWFE